MNWMRDFALRHAPLAERNIDFGAPAPMREQLVDLFFHLAGQSDNRIQDRTIYEICGLSLGVGLTANPYGGLVARVSRDIGRADWVLVYDLLSRLWLVFEPVGLSQAYRDGVNAILAANGVVWELDANGHLERVLPEPLRQRINAAIAELGREQFVASRALFENALNAFNSRPRRAREACGSAYDALESAAKVAYDLPNGTFGDVLGEVRRRGSLNEHVIRILRDLEILGHNTFRHGMVQDFNLTSPEVEFVFVVCAGAIPLFAREL
jgi:hypothetical protein